MHYADEFVSLYKMPPEKCRCRVIHDHKQLKIDEFPSHTLYINKTKKIALDKEFFTLKAEKACAAITDETKCLIPGVSLFDHSVILPAEFQGKGHPIATIVYDNYSVPFILEYPENRFVINGDICDMINIIRREKYFKKKRPLYTYLPLNIQNIPSQWRRTIAGMLQKEKREGREPLFPQYPKDYSVAILIGLLMYCFERITGVRITTDIWPHTKKYAFILTHDVDSCWIYKDDHLRRFMDVERTYGICGAWYFVANRYKHDFEKIDALKEEGHEIGLHGHNHDHKLAFLSPSHMQKRLAACRWFIDKYDIYGFRSAHYLRTPLLYETLKDYVRYDTSMHDAYTPSSQISFFREGCSSLFPFRLSDETNSLMELPITIPEDFKLYDSGKGTSSIVDVQRAQITRVKEKKGLATLVVHPEPQFTVQKTYFDALREVLRFVSEDSECWVCRPRDVYEFWRDKLSSHLSGASLT